MTKSRALPLMIQGTSSDAGKSVLVTALCRIFAQIGYRTAPFKSQNMALNSYITLDGKEIGRAQGVQAEAAGIIATTDMNPILIKPSRDMEAQIVVHGEPYQNMKAIAYRSEFFSHGLHLIQEAYDRLADHYERIVIEGAGSPAEINLNDRELVNMRVARMAQAPVILVADIERGGVFASLVGTLQLLDQEDRDRVIGVIINKFRGDLSLLQPGLDWFEQYAGKPILGVVPFMDDLYIDAEDSLSLKQYSSPLEEKDLDIAVIQYPRISNFTDIDPFFVESDCRVRFVREAAKLGQPDLIILPGSKNTIEDLLFLREQGLDQKISDIHQSGRAWMVGICGGYQMMGGEISDPHGVESPNQEMKGLGFFSVETTLTQRKTTQYSEGVVFIDGKDIPIQGYEIHMGQSVHHFNEQGLIRMEDRTDGSVDWDQQRIGTYYHGIFHNDFFRKELLNLIRRTKGLEPLEERVSFVQLREQAFDVLADQVRKHVQIDRIEQMMKQFKCKGEEVTK